MERHSTDLEGQARHNEYQTKHQNLMFNLSRSNGFENLGQLQAACSAVHHGHAVKQEAGGHCTQYKILHGRFSGLRVVTAQSDQGITGQSQQLKAQIHHDEVLARDHETHAQQSKHAQAEQFATAQHVAVSGIRP